jgi:hypothetical protein
MGDSDGAILTFQRGWQALGDWDRGLRSLTRGSQRSRGKTFGLAGLPFFAERGLTGRWLVVYVTVSVLEPNLWNKDNFGCVPDIEGAGRRSSRSGISVNFNKDFQQAFRRQL